MSTPPAVHDDDALHSDRALPSDRPASPTEVLRQLTLEEKADLLGGSDFWHTTAVERLGVPAVMVTDGPHGLRKQDGEGDHLGLTASVPATCFPPAAGLASTWDVDLLTRVGEALGRECRAEGVAVLLGPGVNMKRSPLCGRNFEYFSEDPLLAGELAAGLVRGVQSQGVGTSLKHFAANNQETQRMTISADVDERTLREIYFPAFERVVRTAQPWTVMCSYNKINGVYASQDPWLLTDVLRGDWGFDGLVVSDWGAVDVREDGVRAGLDLEMPGSGGLGAQRILEAVSAGTLAEADVDRAVLRVLNLVRRAAPGLAEPLTVDAAAHHALAREAATASAVLLRNDGVLPLAATGGPVAVVGEFARTPRFQGAGSSQVNPTRLDDALGCLRAELAGSREVTFAAGYDPQSEETDAALVAEAVEAARAAEVVVLFLGLPASYESEGYDREHLNLPATQLELLDAVADANPNVVVVLSNGSVVAVEPWQERTRALLEGWLLGQAGGAATADLLLGRANPSGRLAETLPVHYLDNPTVGAFPGELGHVRYGEGLLIGYRWYDAHALRVAHPFGHGLSYTTFGYTDLEVDVVTDGPVPVVDVRVTVTNTGDREGTETVQVYVSDPEASVQRPEQELRGFTRVHLAPGASQQVAVRLDARAFAFWHSVLGRWTVEGGEFGVRVGASSRDVRLAATVRLTGEDVRPPLAPDSEVGEWLAHPVAGPVLREAIAGTGFEGMLDDPHNGQMMRAIPLVRLTRFPGSPVEESSLAERAAATNAQAQP
ncbi:glycoside hydrolase family 3 C-terminal domain-containing protein [Kineococcus rubinsiae]|uniref:glycoside hydrolase family 3 C-terminal domain-containing protein n=1 Tax=Kineococcus rubinsiae TaxID=2609562 RepID=UPI00142F4EF3|nr:glycoside hydrolase family 3 C-terminal domain-containing protein [Kineococcus rubinsiae]NIZ92210.1 beta-glucosidase [Kineococcus rubinsiae]